MIFIDLFQNLPNELTVFLISTLPIVELRGAIPVAIGVFDMSPFSAYFYSVLGNILPIIIILLFIKNISKTASAYSKTGEKLFEKLFHRTRGKWQGKYEKYGTLALILFTAIPLPFTGAWTASLAAYLFGVPPLKALFLITIGVLIAGIFVTFGSIGIFRLF